MYQEKKMLGNVTPYIF